MKKSNEDTMTLNKSGKRNKRIGAFSVETLKSLAEQYGTPLYLYDGERIQYKVRKLTDAFQSRYDSVKIHYAFKANTNLSIVSLLKREGVGAECISKGEMQIALKMGYTGEDILFTSSSKSPDELVFAVRNGVTINLDSLGDLENLMTIVNEIKKKTMVSFRVNPDVDPMTHRHIATGHKYTKFGIHLDGDEIIEAYQAVKENPYLEPIGIHSHVGSQILASEPMKGNAHLLIKAVKRLKKELNIELKFIDLGGGIGIPYEGGQSEVDIDTMAETVINLLKGELKDVMPLPAIWLEPGRYFVGDAGLLLTRINSVKHTPHTNFINVDTGFNHQLRPILYEAQHRVLLVGSGGEEREYDIAGNICETGDIIAEDRILPTPRKGDYLAIMDCGAYGFSMASEYNSFLLPVELLSLDDKIHLIRKRESFDDLLRNQLIPEELQNA
ncbi:MAG: diaminopimelate decarboxylase [Acidobacteria bacterium]|nr:MAG: diaminopimelate decarboxylase [Acidobacteriota bacterium]